MERSGWDNAIAFTENILYAKRDIALWANSVLITFTSQNYLSPVEAFFELFPLCLIWECLKDMTVIEIMFQTQI